MKDGIGLGGARSFIVKLLGRGAEGDWGTLFRSGRVGTALGKFEVRSSEADRDLFNDLGSAEVSLGSETMLSAGLTSRRLDVVGSSSR